MNTLWQDLRFGARMMIKAPGFTLIAVLSIALGIAVNSAVFTIVNGMLLKPMPARQPDRLVALYTIEPNSIYPSQFSYVGCQMSVKKSLASFNFQLPSAIWHLTPDT
jgi:hypothetical protein